MTYLDDSWMIAANSIACCDFLAAARFFPLGISCRRYFDRDVGLGTHDITRPSTESTALLCHILHLERKGTQSGGIAASRCCCVVNSFNHTTQLPLETSDTPWALGLCRCRATQGITRI